jgi:hypothetical protein
LHKLRDSGKSALPGFGFPVHSPVGYYLTL